MRHAKLLLSFLGFALIMSTFYACGGDEPQQATPPAPKAPTPPKVPAFDADAAYNDIAKQVSFGPRVLGSEGATACKAFASTCKI